MKKDSKVEEIKLQEMDDDFGYVYNFEQDQLDPTDEEEMDEQIKLLTAKTMIEDGNYEGAAQLINEVEDEENL